MSLRNGWTGDTSINPWVPQFCCDPGAMQLIGGFATVGGKLYQGFAAKKEGEMAASIARQEGEFTGKQLDRAAGEERVAGQRSAFEKRDEKDKVVSAIRARAAASGGGGMETPTVLDIMGDAISRGEYLAETEQFLAESRARGREDQAKVARAKGENVAAAYERKGKNAWTGSILDSIGTAGKAYYDYDRAYGRPTVAPATAPRPGTKADDPWRARVRYG